MTDAEIIERAVELLRNGLPGAAFSLMEERLMPLESVSDQDGSVTLVSEGWEVDENVATNIDGEAAEIWAEGGDDVVARIESAIRKHLYDAFRVGMVRRV
jgi:hypothetical protein